MKTYDKIKILKEFVEKYCQSKSKKTYWKSKKIVKIDFAELSKFNPELADEFLNSPSEIKELFAEVIEQMGIKKQPNVIINNIPKTEEKQINRFRHPDIDKLISIRGIVTSRTKVFPRIISTKFECGKCAEIINVIQTKETLKKATNCGCGEKSNFKSLGNKLEDTIMLQIEDLPERLKGSEQANNLRVVLQGHLCEKDFEIILGARIELIGFIKEVPTKATRGTKTVNCDYLFTALNYNNLDFVDFNTSVSKEEQELFDKIKNCKNPARFISNLIFSDIHGYSKAKECLIYQQFCGVRYNNTRDFIHILLYGHSGTAKSDMAFRVAELNPIHKITGGPHISGVGLTASTQRDELTGYWFCSGGLLPKCNGGLAVVDEIEKMNKDDKNSLHMPMESGFFEINKANVSAKLSANTSILSTSNPKVSSNPLKVSSNCDLPTAILDRFDMIFTFEDIVEQKRDNTIALKLIERATKDSTFKDNENTFSTKSNTFEWNGNSFPISTLTKYIYNTKQIQPKVSIRAEKELPLWYTSLRLSSTSELFEGKKPSPRVMESVLRIARAISRAKMKEIVTQKELKLAISYFDFIYGKDKNPQVIEEEVSPDQASFTQPELPKPQEEITANQKYASNMKIIADVKARGEMATNEFIETYTEIRLNKLLSIGALVEHKSGLLKVTE